MSLTQVEQRIDTDDGGVGDRIAHLIRNDDWARAYVEGKPVRALCGKRWVPTRDPENLPLCGDCRAAYKKKFGTEYGT